MSRVPSSPRSSPFPGPGPETDLAARLARTKVPRHPADPDQRTADGRVAVGNTLACTHTGSARKARKAAKAELMREWRRWARGGAADADVETPLSHEQETVLRALVNAVSLMDRAQEYLEHSAESIVSLRFTKAAAHVFTCQDKIARLTVLFVDLVNPGTGRFGRAPGPMTVTFGGRYQQVPPFEIVYKNDVDGTEPASLVQRIKRPDMRTLEVHTVDTRAEMLAAVGQRDIEAGLDADDIVSGSGGSPAVPPDNPVVQEPASEVSPEHPTPEPEPDDVSLPANASDKLTEPEPDTEPNVEPESPLHVGRTRTERWL